MAVTARKVVLQIHLYLGLFGAIFLVILGLTGSIMAFEGDIDHWLDPNLWYVTARANPLPEGELIGKVESQFAPARVGAVEIPQQRNLVQVMQLSTGPAVYVNPYDGSILGERIGASKTQRVLGYIHQFHLRLATDPRSSIAPAGKVIVSYAGLVLCLLGPTGLILWWRTKRASVQWTAASWFRRCFDLHRCIGIYAGAFLWIAAFTGVLIGFSAAEKAIYSLTHSSGPTRPRLPQSVPGVTHISVDQALATARRTMPAASVDSVFLPLSPKAPFVIVMRVPEETSGSAHSTVAVDQYSGNVLQVQDFRTDSLGYRWIRFNRSIHTGDIWGLPGHIIVSLSSLLLVAMVITGLVIWWKKLAV
ncbi:MAG: PepSY-associated TM helix domain-containing protein [Bryobacteraceae bacterium]